MGIKTVFISKSYLFHGLIIVKQHTVPEGEIHQSKAKRASVRSNEVTGTLVRPGDNSQQGLVPYTFVYQSSPRTPQQLFPIRSPAGPFEVNT